MEKYRSVILTLISDLCVNLQNPNNLGLGLAAHSVKKEIDGLIAIEEHPDGDALSALNAERIRISSNFVPGPNQ
jgi:hypothetical protein